MPRYATLLLPLLLTACGTATGVPPAGSPPPAAPEEEDVQLETPSGTVYGTLLLPGGAGPFPVAVLIAGSGPTDRDGNTTLIPGANNSLRLLAEGLAADGIASLRYDKRGIAASAAAGPNEADLRFDMYVEDAAAWVDEVRDDDRFSTVTIIGHSEGSLIGMIAAQRSAADAFVSISGIASAAGDALRGQLGAQLPATLMEESERILSELEAGRTVDTVPPPLFALFRASVQPYMVSWFRYTPSEEIARLGIPVLIAHGTTDIQVPASEAATLHAARPEAEVAIIDGMNHVLKMVGPDPAEQQGSYGDPTLPVAPELVEAVSGFVRGGGR